MKYTLILSLAICSIAHSTSAQLPETCVLLDAGFFTTGWGGTVETPDGGAVICGGYDYTNSGYSDIVLTKLNASGALQWMKTWSTGPNAAEYGMAVINTSDGGLAVAGHIGDSGGTGYLMKLNSSGVAEWTKAYAHPTKFLQMAYNGLVQLPDGGFALHWGATLGANGWMMLRTDADGEVLWSDELNFAGGFPADVAALPNGDLIFTGTEQSINPVDLLMRKDGLTGATEWMHWYDPGANEYINFHNLVVGPDSTIAVCGIASSITYVDAFAMALTAAGTPIWSTRVGGVQNENAKDIAWDPNEGYVLAGEMREPAPLYTILGGFVARLDLSGQRVWSKFITHPDVNAIQPFHCATASDGGVLLTGEAGTSQNYPQFFTKLDADGNSCPYCPSVDEGTGTAMNITIGVDQGSAFAGPWATASDFSGFTATNITPTVEVCGTTAVEELSTGPTVTVAPNPFEDQVVIALDGMVRGSAWIEVRDVSGRLAHTQRIEGKSTIIERGTLAPGPYTFRISDASGTIANGALQAAGR